MLPSAAELVARFLRASGYAETLASFIQEAGLSPDAGVTAGSDVTIEQLLQEKRTFDMSLNFEKMGINDARYGWKTPAPSQPTVLSTLPTKSNILSVHLPSLVLSACDQPQSCIAVTTADRRLNLINPVEPSLPLIRSYPNFLDSPILDLVVINSQYILAGSMSGKLLFYDMTTDTVLDERKDHAKYLVKLASWSDGLSTLIATAGWDSKVVLYMVSLTDNPNPKLGEPIGTITLPSIPETIVFIQSPDTSEPLLLLTRRDSTYLYYYSLPSPGTDPVITLIGKQNLTPHSISWTAWSPSDVQLCPSDQSLAAVATSSTPHMRVVIVRLLIPPKNPRTSATAPSDNSEHASIPVGSEDDLGSRNTVTQSSQERANLLLQDREEAAILINMNTMAPQTAYSTPKLVWRPDGSGLYVSSDDGIIRGFEKTTGKLMTSLQAHEPGTKLRCLWVGRIEDEECLISGGFDQRLILWKSQ
ncbi:WD40 repeat-like protein [Pleomassaria siparia CBS 279.74]|uniref:WD40 repeat-like protein n=1 Tax=Pleomassaria siparia CBS 279.74 TaxID=1314801 RepID=A0A6G1K9T1_9PLEO|nr:WD40 repeat-like protein [Pleomassaria siparia CBS 279.74]